MLVGLPTVIGKHPRDSLNERCKAVQSNPDPVFWGEARPRLRPTRREVSEYRPPLSLWIDCVPVEHGLDAEIDSNVAEWGSHELWGVNSPQPTGTELESSSAKRPDGTVILAKETLKVNLNAYAIDRIGFPRID